MSEPLTGIELFAAERARQHALGYIPEHDATEHDLGTFALEAAFYATYAWSRLAGEPLYDGTTPPVGWPQGGCDWKPRNPHRAMVKAGALLAAEVDRLTLLAYQPLPFKRPDLT